MSVDDSMRTQKRAFRVLMPPLVALPLTLLSLSSVGCDQEPTTLREEAEQAQEELEETREDAAEMVDETEEDAVDNLADARQDAKENIREAKREATEMVEAAEADLDRKLEQLSDPKLQPEERAEGEAAGEAPTIGDVKQTPTIEQP
jgi:hypothetical protein